MKCDRRDSIKRHAGVDEISTTSLQHTATTQVQQFVKSRAVLVNVPLLAVTKVVKLDFLAGWGRSGESELCKNGECMFHRTGYNLHNVTFKLHNSCDTFTAATKAATGRRCRIHRTDAGNKAAAAHELVEVQIYDKMRDAGNVNSSRTQEVCEQAVASICLRLQLLDEALWRWLIPPVNERVKKHPWWGYSLMLKGKRKNARFD